MMSQGKREMGKKRLVITAIVLVGILLGIAALLGVRLKHVGSLLSSSSGSPELSAEETAEVHTWLQDNAVHLRTVAPGSGLDDIQPLKAMVGPARLVSLGEAAHHNRDFSRVKHRMVEFLVDEMGFTVFAIEASFAGALQLNDYVLGGDGDPERALGALVYPAWTIESMRDMVVWMRQYNATHEKKVTFYGFDLKPATGSARAVHQYLREMGGTEQYNDLLATMMNMWTANQLDSGPKQELRRVAGELRNLLAYLEHQQPAETPSVPVEQQVQAVRAWRLAVQHVRVLWQHVRFNEMMPGISAASEFRDQSMAENVRWLVDYSEGAKTILWAANAHILASPGSGSMGDLLRQTYGDDMVVVALLRNRKSEGLAPDETDPGHGAREGSIEAFLTAAGLDRAIFDLRSLPRGAVSKYFDAPRKTGAVTCLFPEAYDAILFLESTTNARLIDEEILSRAVERLPAPANLDFEELDDGSPQGWRAQGGQARLEFQTTGSHDQPYQGRTCGMIQRIPGRPFGEPFGNLVQRIKASDFQGETIELSAAARVTEGIAYLWLSVDVRNTPTVFRQQIVTSDQWQKYTLQAEVPQNAFRIAYGLAYVGQAAAFIDDVTIATPAH